ncbi:chromo domain-containing protein [Colletotrichum chrysophilum]|uniref:Chromo domain-containing protein n=1 Tax=Colletotrichum chrysophilum TaxID=1836956 RepID=A0AAD9E7Y3_9PEZI|nr:chromo domain-containing protein [Colletotrichum chrysophilum]
MTHDWCRGPNLAASLNIVVVDEESPRRNVQFVVITYRPGRLSNINMNILRVLQPWPSLSSIQSRVDPIDYSSAVIKEHRLMRTRYIRYEMHVFYEPEGFVQLGAPELLFKYWDGVGGRKNDEYWFPLQVVANKPKHNGGEILEVLWEGSSATSEEPYKRMMDISPEIVRYYEDQNNTNADFSHARSLHRRRQRTAVNGKGQGGVVRKERAKALRVRRIRNAP